MRELVEQLRKEEMPLETHDLMRLAPFVEVKRTEVKEYEEDGRKGARRIDYYMLNERGLKLLHQWQMGLLDKHVSDHQKPRGKA